MIGCDIANAIARCLNGVHLNVGKRLENIRRVDQFWPIILQVLAGRKMTIAFIPAIRDLRQTAHLIRC